MNTTTSATTGATATVTATATANATATASSASAASAASAARPARPKASPPPPRAFGWLSPFGHADAAQRLLPRPGPVWGDAPERPHAAWAAAASAASAVADAHRARHPLTLARATARCRAVARAVPGEAKVWLARDAAARPAALRALRLALRREGLRPELQAQALGLVAALSARLLGRLPRPGQNLAAAALLDNRMAEMATGEGKTLAVALAAAVAGLAGVPVHVVTANDYLAARDAEQMAPLYRALGLSVATLAGAAKPPDDAARRAAYAQDVVYATAKALAFDHLRDRQASGAAQPAARLAAQVAAGLDAAADDAVGDAQRSAAPGGLAPALAGAPARGVPPAPLMRGLCLALIDEADSVLLDEAEVPLVLSRAAPQAARRAFLWQALALARQLVAGQDFRLHPAERRAALTPAGDERLAELSSSLGGPWARPRYRREAVTLALGALHIFERDTHYLLREGAVLLLDEVTGRVAEGRVWSRGLHTLVALKEGLRPAADTDTLCQTTFQRFFQRYWRLAGISGTLWEARDELRAVYGTPTLRIPLNQPSRCHTGQSRQFADAPALWRAVAERVAALQAAGRPVLVGTDSVADSQQLSAVLQARGVSHQLLNALHDADEAAVVAAAGRSGCVTVATRMAGRGTDIALDDAARAAGGLHVLNCQHNPSRRLDRQLAGRAARHGEPGSTEAWRLQPTSRHGGGGLLPILTTWHSTSVREGWPWFSQMATHWPQWREERRRARLRRSLLQQDLDWERRLAFAGPAR